MTTVRGDGATPTERYLGHLCEQTFLSLWSYPGVYRNQFYGTIGQGGKAREGKEVCDLIVVFEDRVILFSDKDCTFPNSGDLDLDWSRWFRKAVLQSASQLWGAERWIRQNPDRLFLDRACKKPFPIRLPKSEDLVFHRIVVAHDVVSRCKAEAGGSGSLAIQPNIVGKDHVLPASQGGVPFAVGVLDPLKGFVHVLDDMSLDILLNTLDTVRDFVGYLEKKESLIGSGRLVRAAGEEDLLALYLTEVDASGAHDFPKGPTAFTVEAGGWDQFRRHPQRLAQIAANEVSYVWDRLTEEFCRHLLDDTQAYATHPGVANQEFVLRFLAQEHRTRRRMLGGALLELLGRTGAGRRATRTIPPTRPGEPHYVFLLLSRPQNVTDEKYRELRRIILPKYCLITKLLFPEAEHIIGIATETGNEELRSEDFAYIDAREWSPQFEEDARTAERELQEAGLLGKRTMTRYSVSEYPDPQPPIMPRNHYVYPKVGRNDPCPCESGKKYKRCHGQ